MDYYQIAYIIPKGRDAQLRAEGIDALHRRMTALVPFLADRVAALSSLDQVQLLDVQLNRLPKWYVDGLLLIGDAAHAMSPVAGVGINLAVADAVACASILAGPLRKGTVSTSHLATVQARRRIPTAILQALQQVIHARIIAAAIKEGQTPKAPLPLRIANKFPTLRVAIGYAAACAIAIGPLPEHAPKYARRSCAGAGNSSRMASRATAMAPLLSTRINGLRPSPGGGRIG